MPPNIAPAVTLDPGAFSYNPSKYGGFISNNQNPDQNARINLPAAAATYAVGGMATHWTCATPRQHPTMEQSKLLSAEDWNRLYERAERLLKTDRNVFDDSIRNTIVRDVLLRTFPKLKPPYQPQNLPLAAERSATNSELVVWSGADTVLGPLAEPGANENFKILPEHRCTRLLKNEHGDAIAYADIMDLLNQTPYRVKARTFVLCAGTVLTAQVLYKSGIRPKALGLSPDRAAHDFLPNRAGAVDRG